MITNKYIDIIIIGILVVAVLFTGVFTLISDSIDIEAQSSQPEYVSKLFNTDKVITIDIKANESDWKKMLENAKQKQYISCDVTINGKTFKSVGIRTKGNSSLSTIANSDSDRYSFKFEFDHYIEGQTCYGLDKFVINNIQSDATYMKDYLSYNLMDYMGVKSPLYSYTNVTVNGKDWGFYLAVESLEESFAQRNYGSDYGMLYKPESMDAGGNGMMNNDRNTNTAKQTKSNTDNTKTNTSNVKSDTSSTKSDNNSTNSNADTTESGTNNTNSNTSNTKSVTNSTKSNTSSTKSTVSSSNTATQQKSNSSTGNAKSGAQNNTGAGNGQGGMNNGFGGGPGGGSSGGTDLKYTDDSVSSYSKIFDNEIFKGTEADYKRVIKAIKNINSGTDLEKYVDVDATLRYFAANTVLVNLDSYFSNMKHNYYLYEKDGQLTMLPWDYNLAFGGFQSGSASSAVNFPIDTPVSGISMSELPILEKLLEVDKYKEKYHEYLQQIVDGYFNSGKYENTIANVNKLISGYVKKDASAFYTHDQYTKAVEMIKKFGSLRAQSIQGQLDGTIPSTTSGQSKDSSKLIDASEINLTTMGTQGGGGGGNGGGMGQQNTNTKTSGNTQKASDSKQADSNTNQSDTQQQTSDNGNMQPPDGMQPPDNGNMQPPDGGNNQQLENMPDREAAMKAMQIIQNANGKDLSEDQLTQLKELGLTDDQITKIKEMSSQFKGDMQPGAGDQGGVQQNAPAAAQGYTSGSLIVVAVSLVCMVAGLVFLIKFNRNKY